MLPGAGSLLIWLLLALNVSQARPVTSVMLATGDRQPKLEKWGLVDLSAVTLTAPREEVVVQVVVSAAGAWMFTRVPAPKTERAALETAIVNAVKTSTFSPAISRGGRPIAAFTQLRVAIEKRDQAAQPRVNAKVEKLPEVVPPALVVDPLPDGIYRQGAPGLRAPEGAIRILPDYTPDTLRRKVQGSIEVEVVVQPDGTVGAARVTRSVDAGLDRQALIAANYWLFSPAMRDGKPVPCLSTLILMFQLD